MVNVFEYAYKKLLDFVSPAYCHSCKNFIRNRMIFCQNCFSKINPVVSSSIKINQNYCLNIFAISNYEDPIKSLVLGKINRNILSSKCLGELIWQLTSLRNMEIDYFVPVPLHWTRLISRGYNQAEVIASVLSKKCNRPVSKIIKRIKYTKYQSSLMHHKKNENVSKAFRLSIQNENIYENKNLFIVDDLLTSGSTVLSIAKELIKLKPKSISVIVACKVI